MVRPRSQATQVGNRPNLSLPDDPPAISCGKHRTNQLWSHPRPPPPHYNGPVPFTIRDFHPSDFETLWRIDQDCFPPGISYSRAELKVYMRRRGSFTLVAADAAGPGKRGKQSPPISSTNLTGFIVAEGDRGSGHIITIDVIATARRSGVGSLLLRAAEDRLRAAGCRSVELETAVDNVSALSFYKRHGYSVIKTFPRYYSNGVDALVLEKDLAQK
jgi:[ribosomal protein S18]-alanine N-acetyltransferase